VVIRPRGTGRAGYGIRHAYSTAPTAVEAAREIHAGLAQSNLELVVLFCSRRFDLDVLGPEIGRLFGNVTVVGCTTAGEITPVGYLEGSITGFSLSADGRSDPLWRVDAVAPASKAAAETQTADASKGRDIFNSTCAHCHGPDAVQSERWINLRLLRHRYGGDMQEVFHKTVTKGRPAKGMPTWENVFTGNDFSKIYAFLGTIQES
jgi:cytochrome c5